MRKEFSACTKRHAWERANGYCEGVIPVESEGQAPPVYVRCNAPIDLGEFHYDHIDCDFMSKDNSLDNCQLLCRLCHEAKTKIDIKKISKTKRIIDKRMKARNKRGKFRGWRKFDGTIVYAKR